MRFKKSVKNNIEKKHITQIFVTNVKEKYNFKIICVIGNVILIS